MDDIRTIVTRRVDQIDEITDLSVDDDIIVQRGGIAVRAKAGSLNANVSATLGDLVEAAETAASAATEAVAGAVQKDSNLSDLADIPTARLNLSVVSKAEDAALRAQNKVNRIINLPAVSPNIARTGGGAARVINDRYVFDTPAPASDPAQRTYAEKTALIAHSAVPLMETWTWQGGIAAARFTDGVYTQPQRLMYPVPATHSINDRLQLAAQCAWRDSAGRAPRWPIIFSGTQASDTAALEPFGGDLHAFQAITGQLSVTRIPAGAVASTANATKLIIYQVQGQSLGTNRVGPGAGGETWSIGLEYGVSLSARILSWSALKADDLTYTTETFQAAVDALNGTAVATDGGYVSSESPFVAAAAIQTLMATGATKGEKLHLSSIAVGGQAIEYFMSLADGGDGTHWDDVFMASLDRFDSQATAEGLTITEFRAPWIQGEENHNQGDSTAEYRALLDTFMASSDTEIHSRLGAGVIIRHCGYQCGRIYAGTDTPPSPSVENEISQVSLAQGEKAISLATGDLTYSAWPVYAFEFSGISHMTERGYHLMQSMLGHVYNDQAGTDAKLRPMHMIPGAERWANAGKRLILPLHTPHNQRARLHVPGTPSLEEGLPAKPDFGLDFVGGDAVPARSAISLSDDGFSIVIDFATAWTGADRQVGLARKSAFGHQQGWFSSTFDPGGAWVHLGPGSNFFCDTHWTDARTGQPIRAYPIHQQITLAD